MKKLIVLIFVIAAVALSAATLNEELKYYLDRHNVQDEGYEMIVNFATNGDTMLTHLPSEPLQLLNVGRWKGFHREGTGIDRDTLGRISFAHYEADTLVTGLRTDSAEIYSGDFAQGLAEGHGCSLTSDGLYYEGQWAADRRHGFGFAADSAGHLRVGQWLLDRYMGERMSYTSERIYGIDISRYQHGKGKKKYPIAWNRLRIAHLGNNQKNAAGTVDYPVSFIFIKSTESTSIRNPFYAQDYLRARQHGIPIGA